MSPSKSKMRVVLAFLVASLVCATASAQIYRWVDKDGNVVYSDVPPPTDHGAQVQLEPINSFEAPTSVAPAAEPASAAATLDATYYDLVQIVEPTNDAAVRENAGNLLVSVAVSPPLRGDHRLQLTLDGAPTGADATGENLFMLSNIDRGTHDLEVHVLDSAGETVASSASVTFHMLRVAAGKPKPPPPKPKPAG